MHGWSGTILRVDLSDKKIFKQPLDPLYAKKFLGGRGFNSRVLWEEIKAGTDPLGPDNVLCFAPGMLTGTPLAFTGRLSVSTLSPLTGILGDGSGGGEFAWHLKRAGYDQIVITGRAADPSYLLIDDGNVAIRDAGDLWGKDTWETTDLLKKEHGEQISVACAGPAGERLVRFASTIIDRYASAAPGSGAVFGSKNLKAIAVHGTGRVDLAYPERFHDLIREDSGFFRQSEFFHDPVGTYGSLIGVENWRPGFRNSQERWEHDDVPENLRSGAWKKYETGRTGCHGCPVRCKNIFRIPSGDHSGETGEALEYEAVHWLGTNSGILDPVTIMEMSNLANRYGLDIIALGSVIAYVKELFEKGFLTLKDTGGISLEWEDSASQIKLIHMIARREGFGDLLAEGMSSFAKRLGDKAAAYCFDVKGVSRGVYPAGLYGLAHATSTRGADHLRGRTWALGENEPDLYDELVGKGYISKDPAGALIVGERVTTLADAIGRCKGAVNSWYLAVPLVWRYPLWGGVIRLIEASTGILFDDKELEQTLDRIYLQERAFNARFGMHRVDERLPQRPERAETDEGRKDLIIHNSLLDSYYRLHGCDPETGIPTKERLEELMLDDVAKELYGSENS
jgi:aldehyde:ferredoxin oxidoreductase